MFRNLATLLLYIGILTNNVSMPPILLMLYTFCILIGDSYEYYPKKIQKMVNPLWFFFENMGPVGYNMEFLPIIFLSIFIFLKTLMKFI